MLPKTYRSTVSFRLRLSSSINYIYIQLALRGEMSTVRLFILLAAFLSPTVQQPASATESNLNSTTLSNVTAQISTPWFYDQTSGGTGWKVGMGLSGLCLTVSIGLQIRSLLKKDNREAVRKVKLLGKGFGILIWTIYELVIICLQYHWLFTAS